MYQSQAKGGGEEIIVAARVPWQEGAREEGERMTCMARMEQAIAVEATTVILVVAPELVCRDIEYDVARGEWRSQEQGRGKRRGGLTLVSDSRERALKAGLKLITTCFLKGATSGGGLPSLGTGVGR